MSFAWVPEMLRLVRAQKTAAKAAPYPATEEQTALLVAANRALDDFMASVDHDEFHALIEALQERDMERRVKR